MNTQLKKGTLDLCVLSLLAKGDRYGYELTEELSGKMKIATGTLYLVLKRLKDEDYVTTYLQESENGPARKYYHLTDEGRNCFGQMKTEWQELAGIMSEILG
ncbi:MAG: PadR family transcriptional regulator [Lachnospiraceae bacterium]|nr:PadR family transcriptional regulator [Lachnospiraceae bacterium]MCR5768615.1 PadR family transcriptional regulator [Lachnospiraceae bacterium]